MAFPDKSRDRMPPPKNPMLAIAIGTKPAAHDEPDADDQGGSPDNDADDSTKPEWVHFHDDQTVCGTCQYMQGDQCSVLSMSVPHYGHCEAWEASGDTSSGPTGDGAPLPDDTFGGAQRR